MLRRRRRFGHRHLGLRLRLVHEQGSDVVPGDICGDLDRSGQDISFDGATGKVAFDEFGDTTTRILTAYEVKGGEWKDVSTEEFK